MYNKDLHIHFMGIGGIGMSGIAHVLRRQGYRISGCDLDLQQKSISQLQAIGCEITDHHNALLCQDQSINVLVYSSAIQKNHPEIVHAKKRGIPVISRALMLAELMRTKCSIAIAGSHGKTTTTAMVSHILLQAKLDPTIIIGGHLKNISTNAHYGESNFLVAEADESDRSLLHLHPTLAVITNIDLEHLDTYKDLEDIIDTFKQFLNNLPFYGKAFMCIDDPIIHSLLPLPHIHVISYGLGCNAQIRAEKIKIESTTSTCIVYQNNKKLGPITVTMAGKHNLLNSLGAIAVALELKVPFHTIAEALATFEGIDRRFSYHGTYKGAELFDDYAHHPKEIEHCLEVARNRTKGKLHVIFQPHRFSRTHLLWNDFIKTFSQASIDNLTVTDIFPASETPIEGVTSQKLVKELNKHQKNMRASYIPLDDQFKQIIDHINQTIKPNDLVLFLGAGKIYQIPDNLK